MQHHRHPQGHLEEFSGGVGGEAPAGSRHLPARGQSSCPHALLHTGSGEGSLPNHPLHPPSQAKSKKLLWRMNRGIVRDFLPQQPLDIHIDLW